MYNYRNHTFDVRGSDGARFWVITHVDGKALAYPQRGTFTYGTTLEAYNAARAGIDRQLAKEVA